MTTRFNFVKLALGLAEIRGFYASQHKNTERRPSHDPAEQAKSLAFWKQRMDTLDQAIAFFTELSEPKP